MSTTETGKRAEQVAADYLRSHGYDIVERNWKNRWCEIDIIARQYDVLYFCEVKYRFNANYGDGLDAITARKLRQMVSAAAFYMSDKPVADYRLMAIAIDGSLRVTDCLELD